MSGTLVMEKERLMYSREEAAKALSIGLRTLQKLISGGKIRVKRVGRRTLVPRTELDKFVKAGDVDRLPQREADAKA